GPDVAILLVKCYHLTLTQLDRFPRQTQYWVPAQQACRSVVDNPDVETRSLVALGEAQELQPVVLQDFLRRGKITADECRAMTAEVEGRLRVIWDKVLERDPRNVTGFVGLAFHQ